MRAMTAQSPLPPTSVVGSYAYPAWFIAALGESAAGMYGESDIRETLDYEVGYGMRT